jgi:stringent starvation protein B
MDRMSTPDAPNAAGTSTRPYLVRALHEWCTDNGFTPYIAVHVDGTVRVPMEYVKNNEIVLNIGFEATTGLELGNEFISFKARFGGVARELSVPLDHVTAIYARENGQGMAFPAPAPAAADEAAAAAAPSAAPERSVGLRLAGDAPKAKPAALAPAEHVGQSDDKSPDADEPTPPTEPPAGGGRPALKRVK